MVRKFFGKKTCFRTSKIYFPQIIFQVFSLRVGGQPKFLGKLGLKIEVYQKTHPYGDILVQFWILYTFCARRDGRARKWASPGAEFNYAPHPPRK